MRAPKRDDATSPNPPDKPKAYYEMFNRTLAAMVRPDAKRILDVGCAAGVMGAHLKKQDPSREIWGVEIVPEVGQLARGHLDKVFIGDVQALLPLPDAEGYFDTITFGDVLEHLLEPEAVLRRAQRNLSETGEILVCVPNVAHWSVIGELLQGRFPYAEAGILDATHVRFFTPGSFRDLLDACGLEVVQEFSHVMPNDAISNVLAQAAASLGIEPNITLSVTPVYQQLYRARRRPDHNPPLALVIGNGSSTPEVPKKSGTVSVVIVAQNHMTTIPECMESLRTHLGEDDQIVVVDAGSTDGTSRYVAKIAESEMRLSAIYYQEGVSYGSAINKGIEVARGDAVVLLDPSYHVFEGWFERLRNHVTSEMVGMVGMNSDGAFGLQNLEHYVPKGTSGDFTFETYAAYLAEQNRGKVREVQALEPIATYLPRATYERIGRFDESTGASVAMLDYSWRCRREGLLLFCAADAFAHFLDEGRGALPPDTQSCDVLADKLESFYGRGQVPPSQALFGPLAFKPSFDLWRKDIPNPFSFVRSGDPIALYLDAMKRQLVNWVYADHEPVRWDPERRVVGLDWPPSPWAHTMVGIKRLENLQHCLETILNEGIPGDVLEAGSWRGGASIFARAILKAYGAEDRMVWVADSFEGLPEPDADRYPADANDRHHTFEFMAVSLEEVRANFARHGLLDERVGFLKGWFKDTLPLAPAERYAVLRLDGDMYESTMDALANLYPKLSPGGFLIVDDYGAVPACRKAVHDYRDQHGVSEPIQVIDWTGAYWRRAA